jgi:predicted amidohydrolase
MKDQIRSPDQIWLSEYIIFPMSLTEIIEAVMVGGTSSKLFRPDLGELPDSLEYDCMIILMKDCWAENTDDRPDLFTCRARLKPLRKGM